MKNDFRQMLHLEPCSGWLNDPNGLCFFGGEYHVYFQYAPGSAEGRSKKCWGHWKSRDLLHWQFTGTVLRPDHPDDRDGVYSGCGFVQGDTLYLFYTGNVKEKGNHDYITSGRGANVMLVATKDGHHMSEKRTLLRNADYPEYCSCHVRDPKVWTENGRYYMVLGARTLNAKGCVLLYVSDDLVHWTHEKTISGSDSAYMWECPDLFKLGGRRFLSVSPQGVPHGKYSFQNVYSAGYFCMNGEVPENYREWDCGFDFYAPQTFDAPDGRKILIGWEGIGDIPYTNPTVSLGWQHCLTLPRELTVRADGVILQQPVREIEKLRRSRQTFRAGERTMTALPFELYAEPEGPFCIELEGIMRLSYDNGEFVMKCVPEHTGGRTVRYAKTDGCRNIRIIADRSSAEIYINDGETVLSCRMYPEETELMLFLSGTDGTYFELEGIEVTGDE